MHTSRTIALIAVVLAIAGALASPDHLLVLCVGLVFAGGAYLLWSPTDTPIFFVPFGLQWLQVAVKPIESALTGQSIDSLADYNQPLVPGAWLAISGIAALGLGMVLGRGRSKMDWAKTLARDATEVWPASMVIQISLFLIVAGHVLQVGARYAGPAAQILAAFSGVRYAGLFMLAYWCLLEGKALGLLAVVVALEIVTGMTGYFADFRESLLSLLAAAAAARPRLGWRGLLGMGVAVGLIVGVASFWTAIKPEYRDFLDQGSHEQEVVRPLGARLSYVGQAADEFSGNDFDRGFRTLIRRLSYIDILAATLDHVPSYVEFENGRLLGADALNMVEPRIFFPDKPPTPDDSVVTSHYTGLDFEDARGTSVSIGYLGELYIDFKVAGATIGAFAIGLICGRFYAVLRNYRGIPMFFTFGIVNMSMMLFIYFETDMVRFIGSAITGFLGCLVLQRAVAPQVLTALVLRMPKARTDIKL